MELQGKVDAKELKHLADSGVVVKNRLSRIFRRIEIPQTGLRPANERSVAEDDPRFFWA